MSALLLSILSLSAVMAIVIALLLLFSAIFGRRFTAKCRRAAWIIVLLRLCIPVSLLPLPALISIELPAQSESAAAPEPAETVSESTRARESVSAPPMETAAPRESAVRTQPAAPESGTERQTQPEQRPAFTPPSTQTLLRAAAGIYLAGAVLSFVIRLGQHLLYTARLERTLRLPCAREQAIFDKLCRKFGVRRPIALYVSPAAGSPMLYGWLHPRVILPEGNFSPESLCGILAHELTHYRRHDLTIKLAALLALSLHWFNPLVYAAAAQFDRCAELSCDESVLAGLDEDARRSYGRVMLDIVRRCHRADAALTTHFNPRKKAVAERFRNIMDTSRKHRGRLLLAVLALTAFFVGCIVRPVRAPEEEDPNAASAEESAAADSVETPQSNAEEPPAQELLLLLPAQTYSSPDDDARLLYVDGHGWMMENTDGERFETIGLPEAPNGDGEVWAQWLRGSALRMCCSWGCYDVWQNDADGAWHTETSLYTLSYTPSGKEWRYTEPYNRSDLLELLCRKLSRGLIEPPDFQSSGAVRHAVKDEILTILNDYRSNPAPEGAPAYPADAEDPDTRFNWYFDPEQPLRVAVVLDECWSMQFDLLTAGDALTHGGIRFIASGSARLYTDKTVLAVSGEKAVPYVYAAVRTEARDIRGNALPAGRIIVSGGETDGEALFSIGSRTGADLTTYRVRYENGAVVSMEETDAWTRAAVLQNGAPPAADELLSEENDFRAKWYSAANDMLLSGVASLRSDGTIVLRCYQDGTDNGGALSGSYTFSPDDGTLHAALTASDGSSGQIEGRVLRWNGALHFLCTASDFPMLSPGDPAPVSCIRCKADATAVPDAPETEGTLVGTHSVFSSRAQLRFYETDDGSIRVYAAEDGAVTPLTLDLPSGCDTLRYIAAGNGAGSGEAYFLLEARTGNSFRYYVYDNFAYADSSDRLRFTRSDTPSAELLADCYLSGGAIRFPNENMPDSLTGAESIADSRWQTDFARALFIGDADALSQYLFTADGAYREYVSLRFERALAYYDADGVCRICFRLRSAGNTLLSTETNYICTLEDGVMGVTLSLPDTLPVPTDDPARTLYQLLSNVYVTDFPLTDASLSDAARFTLTCAICARLEQEDGRAAHTRQELADYAAQCYGLADFTPDPLHQKDDGTYDVSAHGGTNRLLDILDVQPADENGVCRLTVQFYADSMRLVRSHTVVYSMRRDGARWVITGSERLYSSPYGVLGWSM